MSDVRCRQKTDERYQMTAPPLAGGFKIQDGAVFCSSDI
jgi:hypothetical protein